ncbi:MAG TPA: UdgX family uracil-DNA binding protein [Acidimicrobiia bacterium]|nr:UdgX family uracil-DNA binding protein [Acidimicrobiia bacterium]
MPTTLDELRAQAARCKACDLWRNATQVVFGEGPVPAPLMLMGEVPGDKEDKAGHPFVGPAGRILDEALLEAGIDRSQVYVTNAVKHFKWVPARGGKLRLHKKPSQAEIAACRQWWEREVEVVQPEALGLLGATAAQAVLGPQFRVSKQRGEWFELPSGVSVVATIHPSAVLRAQERRDEEFAGLVRDLERIAERL